MAVREVLTYPDPILKSVCSPAQSGPGDREETGRVITDLLDTMNSFDHCVGLAAPQIAESVRIAVVDITGHPRAKEPHGLMVLVNPRVVHRSEGTKVSREGCLSLPDLTANVRRPRKATVEFLDGQRNLEMNQVQLAGFEARCVLHEIDHLDGILFLDRVASITDDLFRRQNYG
ncbi:MAG TPA: peptide deformylase [Solirubrobacterales bacterium]|nr:peptide deformylase [Solirubrobacterales bacterium]HMU26241.1 peptide deformylase [Solirubrobacterales bacterium]HMY26771.1 peptide deformylase [Solirubrobacterales bacterium]HNA43312.1 peptide deformylase [Solirubrobacterales bacterium]HNK34720.1 peptide deformylase [Solirubrobacterales bacterium]